MKNKISRRKAIGTSLKASLAALGGYAFTSNAQEIASIIPKSKNTLPMRISLNTSTLLHYKLAVDVQIDMVAEAGFNSIELWMSAIKSYLDDGGKVQNSRDKLQTHNLTLKHIIGFSKWCSDDAGEKKQALDQLQEEMSITTALGGGFSVELFNKGYWNTMDAKTLLKHSYEKTFDIVQTALAKTIQLPKIPRK